MSYANHQVNNSAGGGGHQTGKYVLHAEDFSYASKLPQATANSKHEEHETYAISSGEAMQGWFFQVHNLTGKMSSARRKQAFQSGGGGQNDSKFFIWGHCPCVPCMYVPCMYVKMAIIHS